VSPSRAKKKQRRRARAAPAGGGAREAPAAAAPVAAQPAPSRLEVRDGVARPQAIWSPFPLTEIGMLAGIAIFVIGLLSDGPRATWLLAVGALVLGVVSGELSLREHFAGFRSHTLLLAVLPVVLVHAATVLAVTDSYGGQPALAADAAVAGALAWWLRGRFRAAHERATAAPP
jgi:hypothetical protein